MGLFFKFFNIYLKNEVGLDDQEIGVIFMLIPLSHIFVTFSIGYISNKFSLEERLLKILTLSSFFVSLFYIFVDLVFDDLLLGFIIVTVIFSIFRSPILPLVDSASLKYVMEKGGDYGRIRLWGSLGFIFSTLLAGVLLDFKELFTFETVIYLMCVFMFLGFISSLKIPVKKSENTGIRLREIFSLLWEKKLALFFLVTFLHMLTMAAYHGYFSLYIIDLKYETSYIGIFTVASVLCEVILFRYSNRVLSKFSPFRLLSFAFFVSIIRWYMLSHFHGFYSIFMSQTLHAFSWGLYFITSINYIDYRFKDRLRTSGITLFSTLVFGIGNTLGYFLSGTISKYLSYEILFEYCAFLSLLTFVISLYLVLVEDKAFRLK